MKIIEINAVPYGSTGKIAKSISNICNENGIQAFFAYSWTKLKKSNQSKDEILIGSFLGKLFHIIFGKLTGLESHLSIVDTIIFVNKLNKIKPDILHIHILHSWYLNIPILFNYIKNNNIKVIFTMHDCWDFTGHCTHFENINCFKWKKYCHNCPLKHSYPYSLFDNSKFMYKFKKKYFSLINDYIVVTPSIWLNNYVSKSFFQPKELITINNGIDLSVFKPTKSFFIENNNLKGKIIILGVSRDWGYSKGLDIFNKLASDLDDDYKIVIVGIKDNKLYLNKKILSIPKTENQEELAEIYSSASLFVNPTREDNFPTVNIESIACGTPVITFDTGGCSEIVNQSCGVVVEKNNYKLLKDTIIANNDLKLKIYDKCVMEAKKFDMNERFYDYVKLIKKIGGE